MNADQPTTADDIVRVIENAPISQLQRAFRQLGWNIRLAVADDVSAPTATEEPQP